MVIDFYFRIFLNIMSFSVALVLGFLFITAKSKNKKANVFLSLFLWSISLEVLDVILYSVDGIPASIPQCSLFTFPFLFLYIIKTLNKKIKWGYFLLFAPGILFNLSLFLVYAVTYFDYVFNISLLVFILYILKLHQRSIGDFYSDTENKMLSWIKQLVYIALFFHIIWVFEDIIGIYNEAVTFYFVIASDILTFFMLYWIGHNGFSQSEIFTSIQFQNTTGDISEKPDVTIKMNEKFAQISKIILQEKLFTDNHLNLKTLSNHLNLGEKELSIIINKNTKNNFYHFINRFRIDEFKKLLSSPKSKQLSILGLAQEAGFSSKSTFYSVFKNTEGITPKQYQKQLNKSE
ncbi:MAG: helix-turn-helix domain-containing protein [Flavobacteriaceae bacterium]|nr:MAG: helix-turn-helix domain-containing protein [Flavobacteriaceae bacterium]